MSGVADTYSVLAIGVACFRWHNVGTHDVHCHVEVFNIWLLSQKEFVIDPQSAIFLLQHGFDFNKQFGKGIPYMPGAQEVGGTYACLGLLERWVEHTTSILCAPSAHTTHLHTIPGPPSRCPLPARPLCSHPPIWQAIGTPQWMGRPSLSLPHLLLPSAPLPRFLHG